MLHFLSPSAAISFSPFWSRIFRIIYHIVPAAFIKNLHKKKKKRSFFNGTTSTHAKELWVQEDIHGRDSLAERKERKKAEHGVCWQRKSTLLHGDTLNPALGTEKVMVMGMGIGMDMSMSMGMGMGIDTGMESH